MYDFEHFCVLPASCFTENYGFCSGKGYKYAVTLVRETVDPYIKNSFVHCCLLDLSKAFDRLDVDILIGKLLKITVPMNIIRVVHDIFKMCM